MSLEKINNEEIDIEEILIKERVATCINIDYEACPYRNYGILSCNHCGWYEK